MNDPGGEEKSRLSACAMQLSNKGYKTATVDGAAEASSLILEHVPPDSTVGCGGSVTVRDLGLMEALKERGNPVVCHWLESGGFSETFETRKRAMSADYYLTSTNALSANGELVNIDGVGNRVAAMTFGPGQVIVIAGRNKITATLDEAMDRAKNVAAPLNARRVAEKLGKDLPCVKAGKCVDCSSPLRICCVTTIFERKPMLTDIFVVLVDEDLGY